MSRPSGADRMSPTLPRIRQVEAARAASPTHFSHEGIQVFQPREGWQLLRTRSPRLGLFLFLAAFAVARVTRACAGTVVDRRISRGLRIDPIADARVFSLSAEQNFYVAYAAHINNTGIFSTELWTGAVRNETNDIARHVTTSTRLTTQDLTSPQDPT